jgi:hypothetical protein
MTAVATVSAVVIAGEKNIGKRVLIIRRIRDGF